MVKPFNKDDLFQPKDRDEMCENCQNFTGVFCRLTDEPHEPHDYCPQYEVV